MSLNWQETLVSAKHGSSARYPAREAQSDSLAWRARVRNWLPRDQALALVDALTHAVPWEWVFMERQSVTTMASTRVAALARSQVAAY